MKAHLPWLFYKGAFPRSLDLDRVKPCSFVVIATQYHYAPIRHDGTSFKRPVSIHGTSLLSALISKLKGVTVLRKKGILRHTLGRGVSIRWGSNVSLFAAFYFA